MNHDFELDPAKQMQEVLFSKKSQKQIILLIFQANFCHPTIFSETFRDGSGLKNSKTP